MAYNISLDIYAAIILFFIRKAKCAFCDFGGDRMHNSSLEQRVAMIQNIREISANNEKTMNSIHNVVNNTSSKTQSSFINNKFKFRMLVAILIFGIYAFMDYEKVEIMGYTTNDVEKVMEMNVNYKEVFNQIKNPLTNVMNIE